MAYSDQRQRRKAPFMGKMTANLGSKTGANTMKLFLTGPVGVGKTTVIQRCLADYAGLLWGFRSFKTPRDGPVADILLTEAACPENRHLVAHMGPAGREMHPEVFEEAGVPMLQKITKDTRGLVLMDEIGFIESRATGFQREILRVLALDVPVIGVLRQLEDPPAFLAGLHTRQDLTILTVSKENRDHLPAQCRTLLGL